ncbi:peroxidase family protein [Pseudooctadecabacter jejudonensis]|uniref:Animal heme peroxidase n=1 Tax=Pseudooctadecabacter jejudonensis TaxID=1391910 RepID=A0A1Y5RGV5_9RHOB|nr:peroxidase family protein [Pseudooctadecabacter jejudonensis]SLN17091.1 Animal heme peroxidase [Pseudooctadecabacter jejudonensis]
MVKSCPFLADLEEQDRLTDARYDDGVSETFSGGADPVTVSMVVFDQDGDMPNSAGLSTLFTTFGQFLDHDMVLSPEDHDAGVLDLVGMPHDIARSAVADGIEDGETIAPTNVVTWQLDGSQIYGSTEGRADDLRSFEGGRLRVQEDDTSTQGLLPDADADSFMAGDVTGDDPVHLAGDVRANENPNLLSMHTMFVREHNYWAERLAEENPDWDDQQLYAAARSIVEVELQQITYDEWLPHLIGDAVPEDADHDPDANGQVSVEFSTAAFRFGHTLVSETIDILNDAGIDIGTMGLMDAFFNHTPVEDFGIDAILRGQLTASAQELDAHIVDDLNFFLETPDGISGFSLAALNLARGLDHGLESYINVRAELLGDIDPATLDPLDFSIITSDADLQARLAEAYDDVFQVDLWVGGLAEDAAEGTQLGALFTHIIADQFIRTMIADETFGAFHPGLSDAIIAEVHDTTFADIIDRVTDIDMIQEDVFLAMDRTLTEQTNVTVSWNADDVQLAAKIVAFDINTFAGDDILTLSGGTQIDGTVTMGRGDDTYIATSGEVSGDVVLGRGHDTADLSGTARILGDLETGRGRDAVSLSDQARVGGDVETGRGDDAVTVTGGGIIDGRLRTGRGDDDVTLGDGVTVAGEIHLGRGDDVITVEAGADISLIQGGAGFDTLKLGPNTRVELGDDPTDGTVFYLDEDGNETGESFDFHSIEHITCFTKGTRLITARGLQAIETLTVEDRVWTLDAGLQPITWIGTATVAAQGDLAPIHIAKGALGNTRDLLVSPLHRMMLDDWRVALHCGVDEVLAPAKGLINDTTIRPQTGGLVTYVHIAFDSHQIVMSEGIPSESFYPGAAALNALDAAARAEILTLFPEWACPHLRPETARPTLTKGETRALQSCPYGHD